MKKSIVGALVLAECVVLVSGCGDKGGAGGPSKKVGTPRKALENMRLAFLAGDTQAFVDCFEASEKQKEMLGTMCEFIASSSEFQKAMEKAYGKAALEQKGAFKIQQSGGFLGADLGDENWLEQISIKLEGDRAKVLIEGKPEGLELVKEDGIWKIDGWSMMGANDIQKDEDMERVLKVFQIIAKAMKDIKQKIGQPDYSAERINQELGQAIGNAMVKAAMKQESGIAGE